MILVIGGTGNIGSAVVQMLVEKGEKFEVLARDPLKTAKILGPNVNLVEGDLSIPDTISTAMVGVDKLFLVTPLHLDQVAMKSTAIQAAKKAGVKHIVMSTGIGASPNADVEVGRWHGQSQEEVKATGISYTFLQPGFFMQNMLMFAEQISSMGQFFMPLGAAKVNWVDARDIAAVGVVALTEDGHENTEYPILGPETMTCVEMAKILSSVAGKEIQYVDVQPEAARQSMLDMGMPEKLADIMNELYALGPEGYLDFTNDIVEKVTGYQPRLFQQFAEEFASAFKGE
ncbi:MAG: SDR family NAD(P)-dependent oxidoreductase [Deltaproteobacteria bacterium]|nr:MAG: SDR family NAD(P)-dependent oxidoreductase [Gammaproteobacteria bacterium]RLB68583.1 MAG: SDR family NAD(P)-dependent oxidoreductase [Deltaproteobacteria bacterium]